MNIVVAQFWTKNITYSKFTKSINERYCTDMGYTYFVEDNDDKIIESLNGRSFTWYKPKLLSEVFEKINPDYVLFMDADAVIADNSYRIEDFIDSEYDCIVTKDYGPSVMNAGVLLFKNSDWSKSFLQRWWDISNDLNGPNGEPKGYYNNGLWHDQTCFGHLYLNGDKDKIKIIDNKVLNGRFFNDPINKNFIFHAFSYGLVPYRTLNSVYYQLFNIEKPVTDDIVDMVLHYDTDKHFEHDYFNLIYNDLFKPIRLDVKKLIEIGINRGGSLKLWRDYFVNAEIIGLDIRMDYALEHIPNELERIVLKKLDQSNEIELEDFSNQNNDVDIILDDGSHRMYDQQITFAKLFKSLKSGGIFIIEDLHTSLEVVMPEKRIFNWGDPDKTITLNMLKEYEETGKIYSDYMTEEDMEYLNDNIQSISIYQSKPNWSITSVIIKK